MRLVSVTSTAMAAIALAAFSLGAGPGAAKSHGNRNVMSSTVGGVLYIMAKNHMALYTYSRDQAGVSTCYGPCAAKWPPAILDADATMPESYTLIRRKDATLQIAYKGQPLYLWTGDRKIGDITGDGIGDGIGGVWHLARP